MSHSKQGSSHRSTPKNYLSMIDFGNEAGDDLTPDELMPFFVEQNKFQLFLDKGKKILLATAKKGVGKSALLRWVEGKVPSEIDKDALVIHVKGSDLVRACFGLANTISTPSEYIRDWMVRIATLINRKIGASLGFAFGDDSISLVESAEIDGFRSKNIVTALVDRLQKIIPLKTQRSPVANEIETLKRFGQKNVWILVDDLDATYQRTEKENLELSTFFSACRQLAAETTGLLFRITMRTDVWPLLRRYDESLDKFEQYHHDITWSQSDFRHLLAKRIKHQLQLQGVESLDFEKDGSLSKEEAQEYVINTVFEKKMPWGKNEIWGQNEQRTYRVIYILSYHRPRWAIQLCKLAQDQAKEEKSPIIGKAHIDKVWGPYGNNRIADLISEHKHQCREIEELLSGFRGAERRMSQADLLEWITKHITNHMKPTIEGKITQTAMSVAHFLFRIGFIVARAEDKNEHYEHYFFDDMPDFLSGRTNDDFGVQWEIHPCYREALDIVKLNQYQRMRRDRAR